jgi:hypothetical protein
MSPLADRRARLRYEVLGTLRGTLEISELVRVQNISSDGALIETPTSVAVGATQSIQMTLGGEPLRMVARVRHVTQVGRSPEVRYAAGVEFVSASEALSMTLASLIDEAKRK